MAEPQPPNVHEGIDAEDAPPPPPASADDRKAAAAMSSLENGQNDDEAEEKQKLNKTVDQKDLVNAISRLAVDEPAAGSKVKTEKNEKKEREKEEAARRAKVKVDQADVGLLVSYSSGKFGRLVLQKS